MIDLAAWGRTAIGLRDSEHRGRGHGHGRAVVWLERLAMALSRDPDNGATPLPIPLPASVPSDATGDADAQRHEPLRAADPRIQVAALYEQHARAVLGYLCARLPTLDDAEDALAEVFVSALARCAAGQAPGIGWLLTVARRRAADFYRRRHRSQSYTAASAALAAPMVAVNGPEDAALRAEALREALARVAALPDDQRDALALRFAAGLRAPQIAAILGKSEEATRALLSRALRRLRKELAQ